MIIPPIGGLGVEAQTLGKLGEGLQTGTGAAAGVAGAAEAGGAAQAAGEAGAPVNFGSTLTEAVSSLEKTQEGAAGAAQSLALGTVSDPEQAVVTVEDAQLSMQLAAQLRTKATEAAQSIFQTQV